MLRHTFKKPKTVKTLMGNVFNTQNMLTMQKYTQDCSRNTSRTNIQYVLCIIFWYNYSTIYARIAFIKNLHWNLSCLCFINDEKCTAWHDTLYILNKTKNNQRYKGNSRQISIIWEKKLLYYMISYAKEREMCNKQMLCVHIYSYNFTKH